MNQVDNASRAAVIMRISSVSIYADESLEVLPLLQAFGLLSSPLMRWFSDSWHLQVALPVHGARLLMGSKAFWHSIPFKQSVNSMRYKSAREAPTALQVVAVKEGVQVHPTIFVADFLPVGSGATQLDFQHLQKQKVGTALLLLYNLFWQLHQFTDPSCSASHSAMAAVIW